MAELRISELPPVSGADIQPGVDQLAVADISASETKKATPSAIVFAALSKPPGSGGVASDSIDPDKIDWASLVAESILGTAIQINTMPGDRLTDQSVTSGKVGELKSVNLEDGAVTADKILAGSVTTAKLADASVTAQKLAANAAIGNIGDATLDGGKLIAGTVGTVELADGSVTTGKLADGAALGNLADLSLGTDLINDGAITTRTVADAAITAQKLAANAAIGNIQDNTLDAAKIVDATLQTEKIADAAVTTAKLAPGAAIGNIGDFTIETSKINDGAITTAKIADGAVTAQKLAENAALGNLQDNSVDGTKLIDASVGTTQLADAAVTTGKLASGAAVGNLSDQDITTAMVMDSAITTSKIADGAVTSQKLGNNAAIGNIQEATLDGQKLIDATVPGTKITDATINTQQLADAAVTTDKIDLYQIDNLRIADNAISARNLDNSVIDPNGGLQVSNFGIAITNNILPGAYAGFTYNAQGQITQVDPTGIIPSTSLPAATEDSLGAVIVPLTSGLSIADTGELTHTDTTTADTYAGITYNATGHILSTNASGLIPNLSLPPAGTTEEELGAVYVPVEGNALVVDSTGQLQHGTSAAPSATYVAVTTDDFGHVVAGAETLTPEQVPDISADKITSGELPTARIADGAITAPKLHDYATCLMQEDFPGRGDYLGQLWFTPSTAQLRIYSRGSGPENVWLSVGFGNLQQNNLRWMGTFNAESNLIVSLTAIGISSGLTAGTPFPAPSDTLSGGYFVCQVGGENMTQPDIDSAVFTPGDWALCLNEAEGWIFIDASAGGGGGGSGGVEYLGQLKDVEIGGNASPFTPTTRVALSGDQYLRFDASS